LTYLDPSHDPPTEAVADRGLQQRDTKSNS
jgi:hypothetical protein